MAKDSSILSDGQIPTINGGIRDKILSVLSNILKSRIRTLWYLETLVLSARYLQKLNQRDQTKTSSSCSDRISLWDKYLVPKISTNAIVFAFNEVVGVAKALADFGKDVEALKIKTGVMDGKALDANKIKFLATLPGKDQLCAQFLCLLKEPSARLARVMNEYATKNGAPAADAAPAPQA